MRLALVLVSALVLAAGALAAGLQDGGTAGATRPSVTSDWGSLPNLFELDRNPPAGAAPANRPVPPPLTGLPPPAVPPGPGLTLIDANGAVTVNEATRTGTDVRHGITVIQGAPP